ncbi:PqiC family protein [Aestuariirhabdus litorea]|uniref:ABC-type transport auxiliary lipoprotein component domain-containing protein n=1 Tax=Aestuariirhabdus litorea TaxID=2528527 RepID=A0A3P3VL32_9GAMM|nr:ABC-type transport auxiliary lipoprotein family protein [Aestuariirhabdus litorea]RRJ83435.1 hypothetical protein D0544_16605 [Aestuariirhabdus litorea]RWW93597.1 hypothetical protein DZC74_16575 [Endozoicomonadaceae bacterium GTF-13]
MRVILVFMGVVALTGCLSSPPQSSYYLLRSDAKPAASSQVMPVTLVSVDVANYIDQEGLVLESSKGEVQTAQYHLWAEPLRHSLMQFMSNEISANSGRVVLNGLGAGPADTRRLTITIDQLHGSVDGDAVLTAYWTLVTEKPEGLVSQDYRWSGRLPLSEDGYAALVAAERALLVELSKQIGSTL